MVNCYVLGCRSRSEQKNNNITFHRFPKDGELLNVWKKFTGRTNWHPTQFSRICSKHFTVASFRKNKGTTRLYANSVPTITPTETEPKKKSHKIKNETKPRNTAVLPTKYETMETRSNTAKAKKLRLQEKNMNDTLDNIAIKEEKFTECRGCLQNISDSNCYNIFECWEQIEGVNITIAEGLSKIANIQLSESDMFSKVICEQCCSLLQSAQYFASNVRKSDEILRQRYKTVENDMSDKVWPKPIQLVNNMHNSVYTTDIEIKKEVASDEEFNASTNEISHDNDFINMDIKIEPEELISQERPESSQILVNGVHSINSSELDPPHLSNGISNGLAEGAEDDVKDEPLSDKESESSVSDLPLECMLCMKTLNSISGLKAHVIALHSYKTVKRKLSTSKSPEKNKPKYSCSICRRSFVTSTDLMVHQTCHNKSICYGCQQSFDTFSELIVHRKKCKHNSSNATQKLKTLDDVKRPQSSESLNNLTCDTCLLKENEETHHPKEKYQQNNASNESCSSDPMSESDV